MEMNVGTESTLMNAVQMVQTACLNNQMMHISHGFMNDPDHLAVVASFTVCPDDIAKELRTLLDATTREFLAAHDIRIQ
jgi:hypothetical protein